MKQQRIIPECQIVPGMGSSIDYAELIKRDANTVTGENNIPKKQTAKQKVNKKNTNRIRIS